MDALSQPAQAGLWRRPGAPQVDEYDARFAHFVERESRDAFTGSLVASGIRWVTNPRTLWESELKLVQLTCAYKLGIPTPPTLVTNDPLEAQSFARVTSQVVAKPVRYGLLGSTPRPLVAWTARVDTNLLKDLQGPPVILQKELVASAHLRVVTIGQDVFIAQLVTSALDWRQEPDNHDRFEVVPDHDLAHLRGQASALANRLNLGFSAQDWVQTPEGPVFLEANPSGQWLFIDSAFDGRLTRAMVRYLEDLARGPID
jgi:glutathione synthase/RimK-type ligase-like ATP-grasp enzyme